MGRGKKNYNDKVHTFKRVYGVKPNTFNKMLAILQKEFEEMHKNGGKPPKLTPEDNRGQTVCNIKILKGLPDNGQHSVGIQSMQRDNMPVYTMGGRHFGERRHIRIARKKNTQEKIKHNRIYRGGCDGKPDKQAQKQPKGILFR